MAKKTLLLILLVLLILSAAFLVSPYITIEGSKSHLTNIILIYEKNPELFFIIFFLVYVLIAALSIPGAAFMTLLAGSLFGLLWGTIVVSFASTIGASIAFLIARYLLRDFIQNKYSEKLTMFNQGIEKDGEYYLFSLRLIPVFPFFLINLVMGITKLSLVKFYIVSQIAMLPATIIYVNAGKQLASIDSLSGILSPNIIFAFVLLGIFPILIKKTIEYFSQPSE